MSEGLIAYLAALGLIAFLGAMSYLFLWAMWRNDESNEREREGEE